MVVLVLTACPSGLRGDLTRWLLEIAPGVYVGRVSARKREVVGARLLSREGWACDYGVSGQERATSCF